MIQNRYAAGDDISVSIDVLLNGQPISVAIPGSVVKAGMFHRGTSIRAGSTGDVTCTKPAGGPESRVTAKFPRLTTLGILPGVYEVEFQLEEAGDVRTIERIQVFINANGVAP